MFLRKFPKNLSTGLILISFFAGCSTQLEDRASIDFEPTMPTNTIGGKKDKYGSIYSNSQQGLFATDRRASKVGDIDDNTSIELKRYSSFLLRIVNFDQNFIKFCYYFCHFLI